MGRWSIVIAASLSGCVVTGTELSPEDTTSTSTSMVGSTSTSTSMVGSTSEPSGSDGTSSGETSSSETSSDTTSSGETSPGSESSSTTTGGRELLVGPHNAYAQINCSQPESLPGVLLEAYLGDDLRGGCLTEEALDFGFLLLISVQNWDGSPGLFEVTQGGPHTATVALDIPATGTVEFFTSDPYVLEWVYVELDEAGGGWIDLRECPTTAPDAPCG